MISIHGDALSKLDHVDSRYRELVSANERLSKKDATLWGPEAIAEAATRLNWIDLPSSSRVLLPELDALSAKFRHCTRVILCGMGGSSLGPEVIAATYKRQLFVLDSTDPSHISSALEGDLTSTLPMRSAAGIAIDSARGHD